MLQGLVRSAADQFAPDITMAAFVHQGDQDLVTVQITYSMPWTS